MIQILARLFLKKIKPGSTQEREAYGILCGSVGIAFNILLFAGKFTAGTLSRSVAITADAFNNLSDAASSFVTMVGFKLGAMKADSRHPFGHGRIEYVSGLIVSAIILMMAFELFQSSIQKIIHPEAVETSALTFVILIISILIKFYMSFYNRNIGKKIRSAAMKATALDSLSDTVATTVVLVSALISRFLDIHIDGWCGMAVSIFIFYAGFSAARDTLNPLLGQPPEPEFINELETLVMNHENVLGIHDLIVHDYGPGRVMVSLHVEVPAEKGILELHDTIDNIEDEIREDMKCEAVIHMDPVVTSDPQMLKLKKDVRALLKKIDVQLSMHDFRAVSGPTHTNLIFDIIVPFKYKLSDKEIAKKVESEIRKNLGNQYNAVIKVDKPYTG